MTTESHAVVFQSEVKVTQETENQVSPPEIRSGAQFRSEEFTRFLKMNGVKHLRVAPYHAACNGLAECMVQSFKSHMKACQGSKISANVSVDEASYDR